MTTAPTINFITEIPEPTRSVGKGGGSVYSQTMRDMPAPKPGKKASDPTQYASFFVVAAVPETISDAGEREKAAKDACRKLSNQFASIARRVKRDAPDKDFAFRTQKDESGQWGLLVVRTNPEPEATSAS